ncbi:MAG: arylsulfatase [Planctomycetota bacterium]|nr:arylsulfatase [Planctomycetota bacterium]
MTRSSTLLTLATITVLACSCWAQRPNVLIILADDLGYSDLGCFGSEIPTPNIDSLAAKGLRFTQCYNSARCCPSRASLITGLYPHQTGIGSFATRRPAKGRGPAYIGHLNDRCVTLAEVLGNGGYQTYMVGKWHMEKPGPIARGFDEFYGFVHGYEQDQWQPKRYQRLPEGRAQPDYNANEFYATDAFSDYALDFLTQARTQKHKPWFLYLAHSAPHFPVQAPAHTVDKHVERYKRGWDLLRAERFERQRASGLAQDNWVLTRPSLVPVDRQDIANGFPGQPNPSWTALSVDRRADLARRMAVFAAMVDHVDRGVGRIVADLAKHDELDNTLILFLSDNGACYEWGPFGFDGPSRRGKTTLHKGEALQKMGGPGTYHAYGSAWSNLGNTPLRLYKHFTHEGGICTPLIMHWPAGIQTADKWVRDPVHIMDIMPTLCEVSGANYPRTRNGQAVQPMEGTSLVPAFRSEEMPARSLAFEHQEARALRRGPWKAVWSKRMPNAIEWELYNLEQDRCEAKNLAKKHPERTAAMAKEWQAWARRVQVFPFFKPGR